MGSEPLRLHLFSSPAAAAGIDWFPGAPDAWGLPALRLDPAPSRSHLLRCLSRCLSLSISFPSTTPCSPPASSAPFPSPSPPPQSRAPNLSWPLPGRPADTRQIGFRERKGGKATLQSGNKGAIKAAPKWRAGDASARKSESELAITPS